MVRAGEESGKLSETFTYLADYLERQYEITRKTKSALIYPAFVIVVFILVMIMMMTVIVPKLAVIIKDSGQALPFFTQIILGISAFMVKYGLILVVIAVLAICTVLYYLSTESGKDFKDKLKLNFPAVKNLYKKVYLARIADNLETMLSSGIPIVRTLDVTASVVGNRVYEKVIRSVTEEIKAGVSLSSALSRHKEIPQMLSQMVRVGEETGMLGQVLKTLGRFYRREVDQAVDTIVALIEPVMIVFLGLGVGILLVSVLMPIYNVSAGI
jgi:type IV pilus assembly protein PilC